jgi:hypothetical protein
MVIAREVTMKREMVLKKVGMLYKLVRPGLVIWVSHKLVSGTRDRHFLEVPVKGVEIVRGKNDLVLRPGHKNLFDVVVMRALYGVWDEVDIDIDTEGKIYSYMLGHNYPVMLVLTEADRVEYRWRVAARTQDGWVEEKGFGVVWLDGTVEEVVGEKNQP